jgi:hypothetical protein
LWSFIGFAAFEFLGATFPVTATLVANHFAGGTWRRIRPLAFNRVTAEPEFRGATFYQRA